MEQKLRMGLLGKRKREEDRGLKAARGPLSAFQRTCEQKPGQTVGHAA